MRIFRSWNVLIVCLCITSLFAAPVQIVKAGGLQAAAAADRYDLTTAVQFPVLAPTVIEIEPTQFIGLYADPSTDIKVTFSENVTVDGQWFDIDCDPSGAVTAPAPTGSGSVFTINPDRLLGSGDQCWVTIFAAHVHAADGTSTPMEADHTQSFLVAYVDYGPYVKQSIPANQSKGFGVNDNLTLTFDRQVTLGSYTLTCDGAPVSSTSSTANSVVYTLDPAISLPHGKLCTLEIPANQVTAKAAPYMNMLNSFTLSFTVTTCGLPYTKINVIQGSGAASLLAGQAVSVEGIVTVDFQASDKLDGFFMQALPSDTDNNSATSEGLFVYTGSGTPVIDVSEGDHIRLSATVEELGSTSAGQMAAMTGLKDVVADSLQICASNVGRPEQVQIDLPLNSSLSLQLEAYEGMWVKIKSALTVQQNSYLGRFGQLSLGAYDRLYHQNNDPAGVASDIRRLVILDDGSFTEYPNPAPYYAGNGAVRSGDMVQNLNGVIDQGRINASTAGGVGGLPDIFYRLQPTSQPWFLSINPREPAPEVGGAVQVASFNVNDYFTTIDDGSYPAGSGYDSSNRPRGADSMAELSRQQAKLVQVMAAIQADVYGLVEIEAWDGANAVSTLADALNAELGTPGRYVAVADPSTGTGSGLTQAALIYNTASLSLVGSSLASANPIFEHAPVAQRFRAGNNEVFWLVVNQFKTRDGCPPSGVDADQGDGQGCWSDRRNQQAAALVDFLNSLKSYDPDILVTGDLNSYVTELPVQALLAQGLVNQVEANVFDLLRYSFGADHTVGYLDHALSTPSITRQLTNVDFWHINVDEPSVIDYNTENKRYNGATSGSPDLYQEDPYGSSDHDPLMIGLSLFANQAPVVSNGIADQRAGVGLPFNMSIPPDAFNDPNTDQVPGRADHLTYTAVLSNGNPLPGWLNFNPDSASFFGTPSHGDLGTITVKVTATDTSSASASDTFDILVIVNHPPQQNASIADQVAYSGLPFSLTVAANTFSDGDPGDTIIYSASLPGGNPLPPWLVFNSSTRTFSGVPGTVGEIIVVLSAHDSMGLSSSLTFKLQVIGRLFIPVARRAP